MNINNYKKYEKFKERLDSYVHTYGLLIAILTGTLFIVNNCVRRKSKLEKNIKEESEIVNSSAKSDFYYTNFNYAEFLNNP